MIESDLETGLNHFSHVLTMPLTFHLVFWTELTPQASPASDIAGSFVSQDFSRVRKTGSHDGISEFDRG